jgi:poly-gamma-glutamate capsule biosynthesis protein CapA/YwtB (metallophosphatase superfamily)
MTTELLLAGLEHAPRSKQAMRRLIVAVAFSMVSFVGAATSAQTARTANLPDPKTQTSAPAKPATVKGDFTLVSVGDLLYARPVANSTHSAFREVLDILRKGDVAIGNMEGVFFDLGTFAGYAPGSPYNLRGEPGIARDLEAMGIDMVSTANNHSNDWDVEGLLAMAKLLDDAGVVHAGDGRTLGDARAAKYFATPKGKVALIATASTFKTGAQAADASDGMPARPGISTLRLREINVVTPETMKRLRAAGGLPTATGELTFAWNTPYAQQFQKVFREGPKTEYRYEMNTFDRYDILRAIREGKRNADLAVFTIHAHENADGMDDLAMGDPANVLIELFHDAVDAGADVVMGGGPHSMRGIEIYKGKPIFYGLAVFLFRGNIVRNQQEQTELYGPQQQPPVVSPAASGGARPNWNDGFVATTTFRDGAVKEIRLYPLDHERELPLERRAPTRLASPDRARQILEQLQKFSTRFGTQISIEGSIGVVRL